MWRTGDRHRHDHGFLAWYATCSMPNQDGKESRFCLGKKHLTRISPASGTPADLMSGKKSSGSVQDHVELYRQKDAALLADVRFMSICST